jgi:hypothetical protein
MAEQVAIFAALKRFVARLEAGYDPAAEVDFCEIDLEGLGRTSGAMRRVAVEQGKTVLPSAHALEY